MLVLYILDPRHFTPSQQLLSAPRTGAARAEFLLQSLGDLKGRLRELGSELLIRNLVTDDLEVVEVVGGWENQGSGQ